jgi:TonB family protein
MMLSAITPLMLATAVPAPLHEVPCRLPAATWGTALSGDPARDRNHIAVEAGGLRWNGVSTDERTVRAHARATSAMSPRPLTILYDAGANCVDFRLTAALIAADANCNARDCVVIHGPAPRLAIAPPAPPPPPPVGRKAAPRGSPQSWVTNDDYPRSAVRAYWMGTTHFRLEIDPQGSVSDCEITRTSGYPVLDETTCSLLKRRALFAPAEDEQGVKIASSWSSRFHWELPTTRSPLASWVQVTRYRIDASGGVTDCTMKLFGPMPASFIGNICDRPPVSLRDAAKWGDKPVWIELRTLHLVDRSRLRFPPSTGEPIYQRSIRYTLDASGDVTGCKVTLETRPDLRGAGYRHDCHSTLSYPSVDAAKDPARAITYTMWASVTEAKP